MKKLMNKIPKFWKINKQYHAIIRVYDNPTLDDLNEICSIVMTAHPTIVDFTFDNQSYYDDKKGEPVSKHVSEPVWGIYLWGYTPLHYSTQQIKERIAWRLSLVPHSVQFVRVGYSFDGKQDPIVTPKMEWVSDDI